MTGWTTPADVKARLRRRWERGEFLSGWARDQPFEMIAVPLRGPTNTELSTRFDEVRQWTQAVLAMQQPGIRVVTRTVGRATIGANALPSRVEIGCWDGLWRLLGVAAAVHRFTELRLETATGLTAWVDRHPMTVLSHAADWPRLISTVGWIADGHRGYLREVPVPGVDTKFIERHRRILAELLDEILPPELVRREFPAGQFERRYGFTEKPAFVRLRALDPQRPLLPGVTELAIRVPEFPALAPDVGTVYVVENEISYLAFPPARDAAVLFGSGFAVSGLGAVGWLRDRRVRYWGDIDTHGFVALDRLRALVPQTESLLMDRDTLLAHPDQWVQEAVPATARLDHLTEPEQELYRQLLAGTYGDRVRLEQERVGYDRVRHAVEDRLATALPP